MKVLVSSTYKYQNYPYKIKPQFFSASQAFNYWE